MRPGAFFSAFVALMAALAAPARAETITLTYANFPPAVTFPSVQMERWAKEVGKRTNGAVKVKTFPGGTLVGAKNMLEGVTSGIADIGNFAMSYQPGRFPVSEAVDLHHGFTSARVASQVLLDLVQKHQPKEFEKVKVLALFTCPPTNLMTRTPVQSLKDLSGMELRVAGTSAEVLKLLGGVPVAMPQSDTPEAIQKGVVKGIVSSLEILQDFKFAAYTPNATLVNLPVVSFAVVMNKAKWNSLPAEVQKVMDDLVAEQSVWTGEYVDQHVEEALAWAAKEHGLRQFTLPAEEQKEIDARLAPLADAYVQRVSAQGLDGKQILSDVRALKAKHEKASREKGK
ncbi:MAG: TRAP transporter substrate-binding protein [Gammaproteobacteria bacterium]|nr:TRAP transporter substrate-binding protein [Gammaproteobacteria bacterium]